MSRSIPRSSGTEEVRKTLSTGQAVMLSAVGNLFPPLGVFVTAPILARSLGVDGRGDLAAVLAPTLLTLAVATVGLPEAVTRVVAQAPQLSGRATRNACALLLASGVISTLVVIGLAGPLAGGRSDVARLVAFAALTSTPALLVALIRGLASGKGRWGLVTGERILNGAFRSVPIVALALTSNLNLTSAAAVMAGGPVLAGIVYVPLLRSPSPDTSVPEGFERQTSLLALLHFGFRMWIGAVAGVLLLRLDQVILAVASTPVQLGLYAVAVNISEVPQVASTAFREVLFAKDSERHDDARLTLAARVSFLLCLVIAVATTATSLFWVPLLFGSDFSGSVGLAALLAVGLVIGVPGSVAGSGLSARGHPGLRSAAMLVAAIVSTVFLLLSVPSMGAYGAATATLLGSAIASNGNVFFMWRRFGLRPMDFYLIRGSDIRFALRTAIGLVARRH